MTQCTDTQQQQMAALLMEVKDRCRKARDGEWTDIAEWAKHRANELRIGAFTVRTAIGNTNMLCFADWLAGYVYGCRYHLELEGAAW